MTFDEILGQVLQLLQRQGRVSYRALKRRFNLDDEYLEDLKAELIKAQRVAIDEDGDVLVWTGSPGKSPAPGGDEQHAPSALQAASPRTQPADHTLASDRSPAQRGISEAERRQHELLLQATLGPALMVTKGWAAPEVERAYLRARELCQQVGETPHLFPVLYGLCAGYFVGGKLPQALEVAEAFLHAAQRQDDVVPLLVAHRVLGTTLLFMGAFASARPHLEQCLALYDPQHHHSLALQYAQDPAMAGGCHLAWTLWMLGYPDQALEKSREALALARTLSHPHSLVYALANAERIHRFRGEEPVAQKLFEEKMVLATEHRFAFFLAAGTVQQGWMLIAQGRVEEGIATIRQGLAAVRTPGPGGHVPYHLARLAEAYGMIGQTDQGSSTLNEALDVVHHVEERWWEAELYRLRGELLRKAAGGGQRAEWTPQACFQHALEIVRRQQAKSLELRTAMSLSRLWRQQGKRDDARQLLAEIYAWFTEGFDTADLQEAKALLAALA